MLLACGWWISCCCLWPTTTRLWLCSGFSPSPFPIARLSPSSSIRPSPPLAKIRPRTPRTHAGTPVPSPALCAVPGGSLVGAADAWGNLAVLSAVGVGAQRLGVSTAVGRLLGAPVTAMAVTFFLASVGVLAPGGTQASRNLQTLAIQYATPWILLGAEFGGGRRRRRSKRHPSGSNGPEPSTHAPRDVPPAAAPPANNDAALASDGSTTLPLLLVGFGLAGIATLAGGVAGWAVAGAAATRALGRHDGLAVCAALLAKNVGGGINYVAVCAALNASPEAVATGLCIDNLGALVYFPISNLLASRYPDPEPAASHDGTTTARDTTTRTPITAESISVAFFAASSLLWLGKFLADQVLHSPSAHIPVVTLLAVLVAGMAAPRLFDGRTAWFDEFRVTCDTLGTVCLYLFFTTAGAPGIRVARSMKAALWPLSVFSVLLYAIHGSILAGLYQLGCGTSSLRRRIRKRGSNHNHTNESTTNDGSWSWRDVLAPQRLLVASSSAIGGPPTSVALARSVGWDSLVVPALLVGNLGYALATFLGIAFYYWFR